MGVQIDKPSINASSSKYEIRNNKIIYPLSMIKNIGTLTAKHVIDEKNTNGEFKDFFDFVKRTYKLGKDVVKNIILSGALDCFGQTRKTYIENLDEAINYAELCSDLDDSLVAKPELKIFEEYTKDELIIHEEKIYGFYISNHPTSKYIFDNSITVDKLHKYFDKTIKIVLYFERKKDINTKKGEKMMFINASDSYGDIELTMFPSTYNKFFNIAFPGVYEVIGRVEKRFSKLQIIINDLKNVSDC